MEISYGLAPCSRGNGFAAEALGAMVRWALSNGAAVVHAGTTPENIAFQRTLTTAGFRLVSDGGPEWKYAFEGTPG